MTKRTQVFLQPFDYVLIHLNPMTSLQVTNILKMMVSIYLVSFTANQV